MPYVMEAVPAVLGSKNFILLQTLSCSSQDGRNGLHYVGQGRDRNPFCIDTPEPPRTAFIFFYFFF